MLHGGETFEWQYVDPATWLASMVSRSPVLQDMFASAWQRSPSSSERPWRLVLGFDEFSPGNKLQVQNRRKCMVLSFSFLELGQEALSSGRGWFTCVVLRSTFIAKIVGGWGCCLRRFLERQLLGPNGLAASGCPMTIGGRDVLLFGKVSNLLSDGDGLRQALDWKGASSLKPCFKHFNVYKKACGCTDRVTTFASSLPANVGLQAALPLASLCISFHTVRGFDPLSKLIGRAFRHGKRHKLTVCQNLSASVRSVFDFPLGWVGLFATLSKFTLGSRLGHMHRTRPGHEYNHMTVHTICASKCRAPTWPTGRRGLSRYRRTKLHPFGHGHRRSCDITSRCSRQPRPELSTARCRLHVMASLRVF